MVIEKSLLYQRVFFIAFWIRALYSFVAQELMPFLESSQSYVFIAFDLIIVALGLITLRKKTDIILLLTFIVFTYYSSCMVNPLSVGFYLNGMRDFIPFLFLFPIFGYFFEDAERKDRFIKDFDKNLFIFLIIQFPCLVFQFLKYGANDHGGGSLGNWNSGVVSTLIYLVSFYLIQKKIDPKHYLASLWENKIYVILLIPSFLNETKISFIFFVLYFLLLLPIDRKIFIRALIAIPVVAILLWGVIIGYMSAIGGTTEGNIFSTEYYTEMYLMNDDSEAYAQWLSDRDDEDIEDIPRFTKLMIIPEVFSENPNHSMVGFGVGHFKGGSIIENSKFFMEYEWLLYGSIPYLFHLIIQVGIIGLIWFVCFWIIKMGFSRKGYKRDLNLQLYIILAVVLILFYNDSLRSSFMMLVLIYLIERSFIPKKDIEDINESNIDDEEKAINA